MLFSSKLNINDQTYNNQTTNYTMKQVSNELKTKFNCIENNTNMNDEGSNNVMIGETSHPRGHSQTTSNRYLYI